MEEAITCRFTGPDAVPFTAEKQGIIIEAISNVSALGPSKLLTYREGFSQPYRFDTPGSTDPYVDLSAVFYLLLDVTTVPRMNVSSSASWSKVTAAQYRAFQEWGKLVREAGLNLSFSFLSVDYNEVVLVDPPSLAPVQPLMVALQVETTVPEAGTYLAPAPGGITAHQANQLAAAVSNATGSYCRVVSWEGVPDGPVTTQEQLMEVLYPPPPPLNTGPPVIGPGGLNPPAEASPTAASSPPASTSPEIGPDAFGPALEDARAFAGGPLPAPLAGNGSSYVLQALPPPNDARRRGRRLLQSPGLRPASLPPSPLMSPVSPGPWPPDVPVGPLDSLDAAYSPEREVRPPPPNPPLPTLPPLPSAPPLPPPAPSNRTSSTLVLEVSAQGCVDLEGIDAALACGRALAEKTVAELLADAPPGSLALGVDRARTTYWAPRPAALPYDPDEGAQGSEPAPPPPPSFESVQPWQLSRVLSRNSSLGESEPRGPGGTGVNIYVLSSGVRASHAEFQRPDGSSRVVPLFGVDGSDPTEDCADSWLWYGYGTYAASLAAGANVGVAWNATVHSARFRTTCVFESPAMWSPGGLPSAMDAVLSTFQPPGVMVVDTWWSPDRMSYDDDGYIEAALKARLDRAQVLGLAVFVPAGTGLAPPCDNVLATHPATIAVAAVDAGNALSLFGPGNSSCIDLWAPGGGPGSPILGALASSDGGYVSVVPRGFGASWLAAGAAAQFLELHPRAGIQQLRAALVAGARGGLVTGARVGDSRNALLATLTGGNNSLNDGGGLPPDPAPAESGGGGAGAAVGGAAGGLAAAALLSCAALSALRRRRRAARLKGLDEGDKLSSGGAGSWSKGLGAPSDAPPLLAPSRSTSGSEAGAFAAQHSLADWEIREDRLELCALPDGRPWELGRGAYGVVLRGIKDGVQVVAVKTLVRSEARRHAAFASEIAMMRYVSRDANVVQFYGAVVAPPRLLLVCELCEGGDLRGALTRDSAGALRWDRAGRDVALDATRGLHSLHALAVSHRDLKSGNILLTREGRAKLGDVGLARVVDDEDLEPDGCAGTFAWAAPELLAGASCDTSCDIWSLGIVLWEIATQEAPVRGCLRPPRVPEECPRELVDIIDDCLADRPDARPSARRVYERLLLCPHREAGRGRGGEGSAPGSGPGSSQGAGAPGSGAREASREGAAPRMALPLGDWQPDPGSAAGRAGKAGSSRLGDSARSSFFSSGLRGLREVVPRRLAGVVAQISRRLKTPGGEGQRRAGSGASAEAGDVDEGPTSDGVPTAWTPGLSGGA